MLGKCATEVEMYLEDLELRRAYAKDYVQAVQRNSQDLLIQMELPTGSYFFHHFQHFGKAISRNSSLKLLISYLKYLT